MGWRWSADALTRGICARQISSREAVNAAGAPADPVVADAVGCAGRWLAEAGYAVEEVEPPDRAEAARLWDMLVHGEATPGLPIGVQIIGARFREDLVMDAGEVIEGRFPATTPVDPKF